jgi:preprotein translocase subunit SecG
MTLLIPIFTFILIIVSLFMVLLVLMQKAKSDGGLGAALGGGAAEATFGADTGNVLTKGTINAAIAFFVLSLGLYLSHIYVRNNAAAEAATALPTIEAPAAIDGTPGDETSTIVMPEATVTTESTTATEPNP